MDESEKLSVLIVYTSISVRALSHEIHQIFQNRDNLLKIVIFTRF